MQPLTLWRTGVFKICLKCIMEKMIVPHYSINDNMNPTKGMMTCTLTKRGQRHEPQ